MKVTILVDNIEHCRNSRRVGILCLHRAKWKEAVVRYRGI